MTEAEIMKALKCCRGLKIVNVKFFNCEIPLEVTETEKEIFVGDILDLINRKNAEIAEKDAEIEGLSMEIDELIIAKDQLFDEAEALIKKARAEAINEFAERVKARCDAPHWCVWLSEIDEVLEEMGVEL